VHALAQVASARVETPLEPGEIGRALNAHLPDDVRVVGVEEAPADFHARYAARGKRYAYRIVNAPILPPFELRYAWHVTHALDLASMSRALEAIVGTHDFAAFQAAGSRVRETTRTIDEAAVERLTPLDSGLYRLGAGAWPTGEVTGDRTIVLTLHGDGFLRHMVRTIVGTLVEIGRGRWPAEYMAELLASRDRRRAGPTAPAQGLFLVSVDY
jgi:tRNA pseudouridine38-40 synthase